MSEWIQLVTDLFAVYKFLKLVPTLKPVNRDERYFWKTDDQCLQFLIYQTGGKNEEHWMFYPCMTYKVTDDTGIIFPLC